MGQEKAGKMEENERMRDDGKAERQDRIKRVTKSQDKLQHDQKNRKYNRLT